MLCFGIIKPGRGLMRGSDCLTPATAELLPAALEVCDAGLCESLDNGLGIWSSHTVPQRAVTKQEYLLMHKNVHTSTPGKYVFTCTIMPVYLDHQMM